VFHLLPVVAKFVPAAEAAGLAFLQSGGSYVAAVDAFLKALGVTNLKVVESNEPVVQA
jgi:hypothetical protein